MTVGIKQSLEKYPLFGLAREVKWTIERHFQKDDDPIKRVVTLKPHGPSQGDVLLARINDAFLLKPGEPFPTCHQNYWEAYQQAMVFLDLGYSVDVMHYLNREFIPEKDYAVFCDVGWSLERIGPMLDKSCLRLAHLTTAHPLFSNTAELKRLMALQERRGVSLQPRRQVWQSLKAIDYAESATVLGNDFAVDTYRYAGKPLRRVPIAIPLSYPWPEEKDFDRCRNQFLFFSGIGMVHKGLDLILEAFASMPQFSLIVCGPIEKEKDFVHAFRRELYETENIHLAGWVDVTSDRFRDICNSCVGLVHASCSESGCASVITAMHAGLIPVSSYESSVDVSPDCGVTLKNSSVEEIREAVCSIGSLPTSTLSEMARKTWECARADHSPESFIEEYREAVLWALDEHARPRPANPAREGESVWVKSA